MINEFAERLRSARKMSGLSMEKLADKAGGIVTKQAISKYEKGKMQPSSEVLVAMVRALDIKIDYFFRTTKVNLSGLEFRKKSKLSKTDEERIKHQTIDFLQRYVELEELLNIKTNFENPLSKTSITSFEDVDLAAKELREAWELGNGPIPNLIELLEEHEIKVYEVDIEKNFYGLSGIVKNLAIPVVAIKRSGDLVRKRFTIAHELAHLLLDFSSAPDELKEKLCHGFAGALLLPRKVLIQELGEKRNKITIWELKRIKGIYGISMQAIMARAKSLGIVSEHLYKSFCVFISKKGWRKEEPGEYAGKEKANRFEQLICHAVSEQVITFSKAAQLSNKSIEEFEKSIQVFS